MIRVVIKYLIVILIAVQSIMVIADTHNSHEKSHHNSQHNVSETESHYTNQHNAYSSKQLTTEDDNPPDGNQHHCHQSHCHHASLVYIDLPAELNFAKLSNQQASSHLFSFSSLKVSPDLRPPIV